MKKIISIIFIFTLLISSANAFFFFGYSPFDDFKTGGETPVDFDGGDDEVDFNGGDDGVDFDGGDTPIDFSGGDDPIDFEGGDTPVNFDNGPFDTPNDVFDLPDVPTIPGPIPIIPPVINLPAEWLPLSDVSIWQKTPDNTIIYSNIKAMCTDPDDEEVFKIVSKNKNYDLFFSGDDLAVKNLNNNYAGKEDVVISCNGIKASFALTVSKLPAEGDIPAKWLPLSDVVFDTSIKDHTIIYHNLVGQCIDPDSPKVIEVFWAKTHFDLYFKVPDLLIKNIHGLLPYGNYDYVIKVTCNGVPAEFILHIKKINDYFDDEEDEKELDDHITISSIFMPDPDHIKAGEIVPITLAFKSEEKLENAKATAIIAELGVRAAAGPFDLKRDRKESKTLFLEIPEWTAPGTYYIRLSVNERVIYREIKIVE